MSYWNWLSFIIKYLLLDLSFCFLVGGKHKFFRKMIEVSPNKFQYYNWTAERTEDGQFQCGSWLFSTKVRRNMRSHLDETHRKGNSFVNKFHGSFNNSVWTSSLGVGFLFPGLRPKICGLCGQSFSSRSRLSTHTRKVHRTRKQECENQRCKHCGKDCSSKKKLYRHVYIWRTLVPTYVNTAGEG